MEIKDMNIIFSDGTSQRATARLIRRIRRLKIRNEVRVNQAIRDEEIRSSAKLGGKIISKAGPGTKGRFKGPSKPGVNGPRPGTHEWHDWMVKGK